MRFFRDVAIAAAILSGSIVSPKAADYLEGSVSQVARVFSRCYDRRGANLLDGGTNGHQRRKRQRHLR
jgi:hypothetical protein